MTVAQLKEQLRSRGLPVSGTKPTLVARLLPALGGGAAGAAGGAAVGTLPGAVLHEEEFEEAQEAAQEAQEEEGQWLAKMMEMERESLAAEEEEEEEEEAIAGVELLDKREEDASASTHDKAPAAASPPRAAVVEDVELNVPAGPAVVVDGTGRDDGELGSLFRDMYAS